MFVALGQEGTPPGLPVLQRTPQYAFPAGNRPITPEEMAAAGLAMYAGFGVILKNSADPVYEELQSIGAQAVSADPS